MHENCSSIGKIDLSSPFGAYHKYFSKFSGFQANCAQFLGQFLGSVRWVWLNTLVKIEKKWFSILGKVSQYTIARWLYAWIVLYIKHNCKQTNTRTVMKYTFNTHLQEYLFSEHRMSEKIAHVFLVANSLIAFTSHIT